VREPSREHGAGEAMTIRVWRENELEVVCTPFARPAAAPRSVEDVAADAYLRENRAQLKPVLRISCPGWRDLVGAVYDMPWGRYLWACGGRLGPGWWRAITAAVVGNLDADAETVIDQVSRDQVWKWSGTDPNGSHILGCHCGHFSVLDRDITAALDALDPVLELEPRTTRPGARQPRSRRSPE
jgi:hypothetical protein